MTRPAHANASSARHGRALLLAAAIAVAGTSLAGCKPEYVLNHGAVISQDQLDLVPVGSSREQVLLALGTPSTTGEFDSEVYYYISQKKQRNFRFQKASVVEQRVVAIYFDEQAIVSRVADYGMQDGKVFDFISRTTPTGGKDRTFLSQVLAGSKDSGKPSAGGLVPEISMPGKL